jgi:hypothetical protein
MKKLKQAEAELIKKIEMLQLSLELIQKEIARTEDHNLDGLFGNIKQQLDEL